MREWRDLAKDADPEGFVFPSEVLTTPLSAENLWRRRMQPRLEKAGLSWATFQILRKTNASLSKKYGIDPKVAADQRGHGLGVRMAVYTSSDLETEASCCQQTRSLGATKTVALETLRVSLPGLME